MPMTVKQALAELEKLGSEPMRAYNAKSGAGTDQFGVKLGDIRTVAKKIKGDHALGLALWKTGNVDAQFLATLMLTPRSLSAKELDGLVRTIRWDRVADWLNNYVVKQHPEREALRVQWMKSKDRWQARAGWDLTCVRVAKDPAGLDLAALLDRIEKEMPKAKPEVQWTMNFTLGTIGVTQPAHRRRAVAIGEKIGLYRDWPVSKGCIPPYVPVWVAAMTKPKG